MCQTSVTSPSMWCTLHFWKYLPQYHRATGLWATEHYTRLPVPLMHLQPSGCPYTWLGHMMEVSCHESVFVELTPGLVRLWPDHSTVGPDPHLFSSIALWGVTDKKPKQRCVLHYACLLDGFVHASSLLFFLSFFFLLFWALSLMLLWHLFLLYFIFTIVEYLCSSYADWFKLSLMMICTNAHYNPQPYFTILFFCLLDSVWIPVFCLKHINQQSVETICISLLISALFYIRFLYFHKEFHSSTREQSFWLKNRINLSLLNSWR